MEKMNEGYLEYAIRQAHNHFDEWNNAQGHPIPRTRDWYKGILSCLEYAVKAGIEVERNGIVSDFVFEEDNN